MPPYVPTRKHVERALIPDVSHGLYVRSLACPPPPLPPLTRPYAAPLPAPSPRVDSPPR